MSLNRYEKAIPNEYDKRKHAKIQSIERKVGRVDVSIGSKPATERIRGYALVKIRKRILWRDRYTCQVCGRVGTDNEIDHVVPLAQGGSNADMNLQSL